MPVGGNILVSPAKSSGVTGATAKDLGSGQIWGCHLHYRLRRLTPICCGIHQSAWSSSLNRKARYEPAPQIDYECFEEMVRQLQTAGLTTAAQKLDNILHRVAWTSGSELIGELGLEILTFQRTTPEVSVELKGTIGQADLARHQGTRVMSFPQLVIDLIIGIPFLASGCAIVMAIRA